MSQVETTATEPDRPAEKIAIKVNDDPVAVTDKHQTGASIKAAAVLTITFVRLALSLRRERQHEA